MEEKLYSEEDLKEALFYALYVEKTNGYITRTTDSIVREAIQAIKLKKHMDTNSEILSNEPLNTHKGMIMQTESGNVAHVLADPNMSKETEQAIAKMIDLAYDFEKENVG